jgi:lysophospholipase L1-like esterase
MGVAGLLTLLLSVQARLAVLEPLLAAEDQARAAEWPERPDLPPSVRLDRHGALVIPGPFRDLELEATVTLGPGAILELRTRAPDPEAARGHALFLPADDVPGPPTATSAGARWIWEEPGLFAPLGEPGPRLPSGEPTALQVVLEGRVFSAWLGEDATVTVPDDDIRPWRATRPTVRTASLRLPAGDLVLLAARGEVLIEGLAVVPAPPSASPDPVPAAWRTSGLPLLAALALALISMHLLERSAGAALAPQVLALLPLPLALAGLSREGTLTAAPLAAATLCCVILASLPALLAVHASRGRRVLLVLLAALFLPPAISATAERPLPLDGRSVNTLRYVDTHAEPLAADRLHLEHPLFRRWNGWLADHAFKGRRPAAVPDGQRVLVLGGSSTWGYHLPQAARVDWPGRLEALLSTDDHPVEVLNAAWPAATGHRILPFLEHELLALSPDLVVICLRYNDAFALARPDEQAWLSRRLDEGTTWSAWAATEDRREEASAWQAYSDERWRPDGVERPRAAPWAGGGGPPEAFAALLERMSTLAASVGAELVLVVEPLASTAKVAWAEELGDAMTGVADRLALRLVDPRRAMASQGGDALFMDVVHPTREGHRVLAETLAPTLADALAERR